MTLPIIKIAGDDWRVVADLSADSNPSNLTGASVRFGVVRDQDGALQGAAITASSSETGAAWPIGRVVCPVPSATTTALSAGPHHLEIEVTIGGEKTTYCTDSFTVRKQALT